MFKSTLEVGDWAIAHIPNTGTYKAPVQVVELTPHYAKYRDSKGVVKKLSRPTVSYIFADKQDAYKVHDALREHTQNVEVHVARIRKVAADRWLEKVKMFRSMPKEPAPASGVAKVVEGAVEEFKNVQDQS